MLALVDYAETRNTRSEGSRQYAVENEGSCNDGRMVDV